MQAVIYERAVVLTVKQNIEKCTSAQTLTQFGYIYHDNTREYFDS